MKKTITALLSLLCCLALGAQNTIKVEGTVTELSSGEPLVGVGVLVKGTSNGVGTDIDGRYQISVAPDAVLEFACIGFDTVEIPVEGKSEINVTMGQAAEFLEESVVVGYSVVKKRDVLGAVSKVNGDDIRKVPVSSVQQSLQGRVAGVDVTSQTGAPGANISVRVRGTSSISSSNEPLYIVDGVAVEAAFNNLSPNDIENITILKDASSAAIYGSRASNGVVLITTKSGKSGDARVSYNMQAGVQFHGHLTPMCNTDQYIELYNEAATSDNATSIVKRALIEGDYVKDFPNVNHLKEIFRVAPIHQHELSISGGSDKTQYMVTGSYYGQDGIIRNTSYNRVSLRSNVSSQVKSWLKVGLNVAGAYSDSKAVSASGDGYVSEGGSVVRYALFRNPAIPVKDAQGNWVDLPSEYYGKPEYNTFFGDGYSPEGLAANTDRNTKEKSLLTTGNILINFTKNIFLNTTFGLDYKNSTLRVFNPTWGSSNRINSANSLDVTTTEQFNWTVNSTFNHAMTFGKNNLSYLVGFEAIHNSASAHSMSDTQFADTNPDVLYVGLGEGINRSSQSSSASALLSFFASVNYNFDSRYYLSAILREDGSSRFSRGNRWGTFYSVSAGWNIDQEGFMADKRSWLDKLKLRLGYGSIGNQNIGLYAYADRYDTHYYYSFGGAALNGYAQTALGNDKLKWETSNQFNVGLDMEMFKGSFGWSLDGYYKVTRDMLVQESLPLSVGNTSTPWVNNGSVLNAGVDLEIFYRRDFKDWGFDITLNGGYLYNKVLSLNSPILGGRVDSGVFATKTEVGHPIGSFFLYKMDGIFQDEGEIITSAYQGANVKPGDVKYVDVCEDGVIDSNDRTYCGSAMPKFSAGLNLSAYWKSLDLSLFFQGAFGQKIFSQVNYDIEGYYRGFNLTKRYYDQHWTPENPSNSQPRASWSGKSNNVKVSTRFLEDGSYFRLKNIQIGYTFNIPENWKISKIRIYLAATNLFTATKYNGLDPEMTVSTNSAAEGDRANGIDWGTYPTAKSVTAGLNFSF